MPSKRSFTKHAPTQSSSPGFSPFKTKKQVQLQGPKSSQLKRVQRVTPHSTQARQSKSQLNHSCAPPQSNPSQHQLPTSDPTLPDLDEDLSCEVILALDMRAQNTVGAAYFSARERKLFLLSDIKHGGLQVLEQVKEYVQPTVVLMPSRIDDKVDAVLDPSKGRRATEWSVDPYVLEVRPSGDFATDMGRAKLGGLQLKDAESGGRTMEFAVPDKEVSGDHGDIVDVGFTTRQGSILRLAGKLDLESDLSVGCAGAILTYLKKKRAVGLPSEDRAVCLPWKVEEVGSFGLEGTMLLNADTLASLGIFKSESHPHSHNQGPSNTSGSKEDLSVFGLFRPLAKTPQAKHLLREYFLRPSLDLDIIQERHDTLAVLLMPDNEKAMQEMIKSLNSIKNMRTVMIHLHKGTSNGTSKATSIKKGVWMNLRSFAFHALGVRAQCIELRERHRLPIFDKVLENFDESRMKAIGRDVVDTIDFPASVEEYRTVVKANVDEELDELKRTYNGIEDLLGEASRAVTDSIPSHYALSLNVVFFPQIGFMISMPADPQTGRAEWEGTDTEVWERIFSTEDRVYYKDYRMKELDSTIGDIHANICDREIDIIHGLAERVLGYESLLCVVSDICGEIDCLLALAQGAKLYRLGRPRVVGGNQIDITNGRHILQELTVPAYIGNDTYLQGGAGAAQGSSEQDANQDPLDSQAPSVLVMTGPNYSGKSVYLKQVALIVFLAHVGSYVPADRATIGLTDKIMTRISTRETVSKAQSAFMIDLQQIASATSQLTRRSLIVVDEFGKGTNLTDGAGLVCGVLEYFLSLGDECPKVLAATHFHEIFENKLLKTQPALCLGHMDVRLDMDAEESEDQVTYLYKLQPGRSLASFGTLCASLNGIDKVITTRAEEIIVKAAQGGDLVAACAAIDDEELKDLNLAEGIARKFLEQKFAKPEGTKEDVDFRRFLEELVFQQLV